MRACLAWVLAAVLVGLVCAAAPASADEARAQILLDEGVELFKAGRLQEAEDAIRGASALAPDKPNPYRWLALVKVRQGNCAEAVRLLDQFVAKVPADDKRLPEAVVIRDKCHDEIKPKFGTLIVESTPDGAEVRLDDAKRAPLGVTPFRGDATPIGFHVVIVDKAGFATIQKSVTVEEGQTIRLDLALVSGSGKTSALSRENKRRRWLIGGLVAGAVVLVGVGLGVGLGLGLGGSGPRILDPVGGSR